MRSLLSNKADSDQTTADSSATLDGSSTSSLWPSTNEISTEKRYSVKQLKSQYQEHDSSSTLSTGQSRHESPHLTRSNFQMQDITFQHGFFETHKMNGNGEDCVKPSLLCGNAVSFSSQVQTEHNQSLACVSYPLAEPYFGRIIAAYEPNAVVYPQMMGISPARVVLPLDCTKGMPIYVNAKQYHAILRRRQIRAKLEAQNKLAKSRKKYLHESRHLHALKRARGSGGRFLNAKSKRELKSSTQTNGNDLSLRERIEPQDRLHSENDSWEASPPTYGSDDVSCIFNGRDDILLHPHDHEYGVSISSSRVPTLDERLLLSIDRCSRISTAT